MDIESRVVGLKQSQLPVSDRAADSVDHYRRWDADGHKFLVRADDRRVQWNGNSHLLSAIRNTLRSDRAFRHVGQALHQGHPAQLHVAETGVVLARPAKKTQTAKT